MLNQQSSHPVMLQSSFLTSVVSAAFQSDLMITCQVLSFSSVSHRVLLMLYYALITHPYLSINVTEHPAFLSFCLHSAQHLYQDLFMLTDSYSHGRKPLLVSVHKSPYPLVCTLYIMSLHIWHMYMYAVCTRVHEMDLMCTDAHLP